MKNINLILHSQAKGNSLRRDLFRGSLICSFLTGTSMSTKHEWMRLYQLAYFLKIVSVTIISIERKSVNNHWFSRDSIQQGEDIRKSIQFIKKEEYPILDMITGTWRISNSPVAINRSHTYRKTRIGTFRLFDDHSNFHDMFS